MQHEGLASSSRFWINPSNTPLRTQALLPLSKLLYLQKLALIHHSALSPQPREQMPQQLQLPATSTFPVHSLCAPSRTCRCRLIEEALPWGSHCAGSKRSQQRITCPAGGQASGWGGGGRGKVYLTDHQDRSIWPAPGSVCIFWVFIHCFILLSQFWEIISISQMGPELL